MKKVKSNKLSLNKQTVINLNAVKAGVGSPTFSNCGNQICTFACNNATFQQTVCGTCPTPTATCPTGGRISCKCDNVRDE